MVKKRFRIFQILRFKIINTANMKLFGIVVLPFVMRGGDDVIILYIFVFVVLFILTLTLSVYVQQFV